MLSHLIPLVGSYLEPDFLNFWLYPFFCLCFVSTVPVIIRKLFYWR